MYNFGRKFKIDYKGLESYLKSLKESDFRGADGRRGTNPNGKMRSATSIDEVLFFKKDKTKIAFSDVILYGQPFLVDLLGNDLSIAILTKSKHKTPKGRSVKAKYDATIIDDCRKLYGTPLNGYWVIPDEFIDYI